MSFLSILLPSCCVVFSVILSNVHCDTVVGGKTYVIRSPIVGAYIKTVGDGKLCDKLSGITAQARRPMDPFPSEYKWMLNNMSFNGQFQLANERLDDGHAFNEISLYSPPPSCYMIYRGLELIPDASKTTYKIVNGMDGRCLTIGSDSSTGQIIVVWWPCGGGVEAQSWIFQETTPAGK